ncbi:MAG: STAS domain-containing protein [Oscillochloridaceae bacterium]|nr:STAS domain-containing protein [Chloroflexaceae bacterium]MDW8390469.1 STAS domain-containing protein [Oscillochloridaceae bacterium]
MLPALLALAIIIFQTVLATLIAVRSRDQLASRLFIGFSIVLIAMVSGTLLRDVAGTPTAAYVSLGLSTVMLGCYFALLPLLLSALFVPQWWEGPTLLQRPIFWISLPYVLITAAISVDFIARLGFVIEGVYFADVYRIKYARPVGTALILLAAIGQLVLLVMLGFTFFDRRHRQARPAIVLLALCFVFSLVMGGLTPRIGPVANQIIQIQTFPLVATLGYLALGTRLFSPTRAALDVALGALREAIAVTDASGAIVFANPSARRLGLQVGEPLDRRLGPQVRDVLADQAADNGRLAFGLRTADYYLEVVVVPIRDPRGAYQGALALVRDVTETARYQSLLETERARLAATVADLQRAQEQEKRLVATVRALSFPLIPVLPGVLVMPLVGELNGARTHEFLEALLQGIESRRASTVMLDITGVIQLDAEGARGLLTGIRAAALLGARCVLVGVQPDAAQALIASGITLSEAPTAATLEQAVVGQLARKHF